jgi:hypothetical protein
LATVTDPEEGKDEEEPRRTGLGLGLGLGEEGKAGNLSAGLDEGEAACVDEYLP